MSFNGQPANLELPPAIADLSTTDYTFLCKLVYERSRIHLGPDKKTLVAARLAKRLRSLDIDNFSDYCHLLRSSGGGAELPHLIDRISTNHTHFFREMKHFDFLREKILPAWRSPNSGKHETFNVWSAASSTGEEPYSLAIHLAQHLAPAESKTWQIEASDISTRVLDIARQGIYEAEKLEGISPNLLREHFQKGVGERNGQFRAKENIRERVRFHHLNLLEPPYPFTKQFHLILCRNVMIYFDRTTQKDLIAHLSERLVPGGHLFVGHSESLSGIRHSLQLVQSAIYLKPTEPRSK